MSAIEIVERPTSTTGRGKELSDESAAVLETLNTGKAVRVALNGVKMATLRNRFVCLARDRNVSIHTHKDGDSHLIAWAEPKAAGKKQS